MYGPNNYPMRAKSRKCRGGRQPGEEITLLDVVRHAKPSVLIGVSGQPGAFTEEAVREMAKYSERPVIFPLSNPTSRSEATAQDLMDWTEGQSADRHGEPLRPSECGREKDSHHADE